MTNHPPIQITPGILELTAEISKLLGKFEGGRLISPEAKLRRQNRIRTIKDTLAIEGNTMTLEQVTALIDGKKVIGKQKEILEVQNANRLYSNLHQFHSGKKKDLLEAHKILMEGLVPDAGKFRTGSVGILKNGHVHPIAPQAKWVDQLIENFLIP